MAHITQTITQAITRIQPFADLPPTENNIYPRRRLIAQSSTTITAKDALDTKTIDIDVTLPVNFAYALDQLYIGLGAGGNLDVDNYEPLALCTLQFSNAALSDVFFSMESPGITFQDLDGSRQTYSVSPTQKFSELFSNQIGLAPTLSIALNDRDAVNLTAALNLRFYASFLQYDIRQVDQVVVNAPMPVSVR